jgi:hypothetical protein
LAHDKDGLNMCTNFTSFEIPVVPGSVERVPTCTFEVFFQ